MNVSSGISQPVHDLYADFGAAIKAETLYVIKAGSDKVVVTKCSPRIYRCLHWATAEYIIHARRLSAIQLRFENE